MALELQRHGSRVSNALHHVNHYPAGSLSKRRNPADHDTLNALCQEIERVKEASRKMGSLVAALMAASLAIAPVTARAEFGARRAPPPGSHDPGSIEVTVHVWAQLAAFEPGGCRELGLVEQLDDNSFAVTCEGGAQFRVPAIGSSQPTITCATARASGLSAC